MVFSTVFSAVPVRFLNCSKTSYLKLTKMDLELNVRAAFLRVELPSLSQYLEISGN